MNKLNQLLGQVVVGMGTAAKGPLITIGDKLGLYKTLAESKPMGATELAKKAQTALPYVQQWQVPQAESGYVEYDAQKHQFYMTAEQVAVFGGPTAPFL